MSVSETRPSDSASVVRLGVDGPEMVQMRWGWEPQGGAEAIINIRAETANVGGRRCLVPAKHFALFTGTSNPKRRWLVSLKGEHLFFFAGLWREATLGWPESYAIITVDAAPDLAPLTDRQMAVLRPLEARSWLIEEEKARDLLEPLPAGSYEIVEET